MKNYYNYNDGDFEDHVEIMCEEVDTVLKEHDLSETDFENMSQFILDVEVRALLDVLDDEYEELTKVYRHRIINLIGKLIQIRGYLKVCDDLTEKVYEFMKTYVRGHYSKNIGYVTFSVDKDDLMRMTDINDELADKYLESFSKEINAEVRWD